MMMKSVSYRSLFVSVMAIMTLTIGCADSQMEWKYTKPKLPFQKLEIYDVNIGTGNVPKYGSTIKVNLVICMLCK